VDAEDNKLLVLARATRGRVGGADAAAIRDLDGRTYAAAALELTSLRLSAIAAAISMASSSAAKGLEAVVLLAAEPLDPTDLALVSQFAGAGVPVYRVSASGEILEQQTS